MPQLLDHRGEPLTRSTRSADRAAELNSLLLSRVRAKYDAAQTSRDNSNHWGMADSLSAAAANSPEVRQKLRDRSRYEFSNNTYCAGMYRTFANDVIGTGPRLQMQSGDRDSDSAVERAFWKWSVVTRFADKLRTMRIAQTRDGEAFGIFVTNMAQRHPVKIDLRLYEAEQIASPWTAVDEDTSADGIIFDDFGNPAAYNLLDSHPGDASYTSWSLESELVPARSVIHLFRCDRPGQVRGIPEATAALPLYAQLRRYTLAVIAAAETVASIAGLIKSQSPVQDPDDITPLDAIDIERGMWTTLPKGWDAIQMKAEQPATTYAMFKREIVNEIARVLGMPYNVAAGDSSSYNYSSGRLDHKTYYKLIRVDRSQYEIDALDPTFSRWWEEGRMIPGVLPDEMRQLREPPMHTWGWDGDEHIDPLKEANAQKVRLEIGMTTYAQEFGQIGLDWEDQFEQQQREQAQRTSLGLPSPAPPQSGSPAAEDAMAQRIAEIVLEQLT